jgi:hypothetical protein
MNEQQLQLLKEAADYLGPNELSPALDWWKRYFLHVDQVHMVLTDEGWEPASCYADTPVEDRPDILDEVNAPEGKALMR